MQVTGITAVWILFACSTYLHSEPPVVSAAFGRIVAAGGFVLPICAGLVVVMAFGAVDLSVAVSVETVP